jgi:hypothetical protein
MLNKIDDADCLKSFVAITDRIGTCGDQLVSQKIQVLIPVLSVYVLKVYHIWA